MQYPDKSLEHEAQDYRKEQRVENVELWVIQDINRRATRPILLDKGTSKAGLAGKDLPEYWGHSTSDRHDQAYPRWEPSRGAASLSH